MKKQAISLILCFIIVAFIPVSIVSAQGTRIEEPDIINAGSLYFGTAEITDGSGNSRCLDFIYSPGLTINEYITSELSDKLSYAGITMPEIKYDYELLNRQSFLIVGSFASSSDAEYFAGEETLLKSFAEAYPNVSFTDAEPAEIDFGRPVSAGDVVRLSEDKTEAEVSIDVEPVYIEREVNGEKFRILMVSNRKYRYTVGKFDVTGCAVESDSDVHGGSQTTTADDVVSSADTQTSVTTTTTTTQTTAATTVTTTAVSTTTSAPAATASTRSVTRPTIPVATTVVQTISQIPQPDNEGDIGYVITKTWNLNVRKGPGMDYGVIALLAPGTQVTVIEQIGTDWYHIKARGGIDGYCALRYIEVK